MESATKGSKNFSHKKAHDAQNGSSCTFRAFLWQNFSLPPISKWSHNYS
jgi:hypothetical protein